MKSSFNQRVSLAEVARSIYQRLPGIGALLVGLALVWPSITIASQTQRATESAQENTRPAIIAHRGASGYLPEHTLAAKAMAHAMGADYLEQDLVMTKDGELVVLHDLYLDRVSDVAAKFPGRARADGRHYVIDFTLAELQQLNINERRKTNDPNDPTLAFPGRFGLSQSQFRVHTFAQELELIRELNRTTGKFVGIYPEIKSPDFHHRNGQDIAKSTLNVLQEFGYTQNNGQAYLQSFDPNELKRIKTTLMPEMGIDLPLVQLIARTRWNLTQQQQPDGQWVNYDYDWMLEPGAMREISGYADGVGPHIGMVLQKNDAGRWTPNSLVADAQAQGLVVHAYTVRADALPKGIDSVDQLHGLLFEAAGVDGVFTDFPDLAVKYLNR